MSWRLFNFLSDNFLWYLLLNKILLFLEYQLRFSSILFGGSVLNNQVWGLIIFIVKWRLTFLVVLWGLRQLFLFCWLSILFLLNRWCLPLLFFAAVFSSAIKFFGHLLFDTHQLKALIQRLFYLCRCRWLWLFISWDKVLNFIDHSFLHLFWDWNIHRIGNSDNVFVIFVQ